MPGHSYRLYARNGYTIRDGLRSVPSIIGSEYARRFLTTEQKNSYGRFHGEPNELLGYQLSPRLADAGESVFWRCGNCVLLPGQHQLALGASMATSLNMGSGVNINMGAGALAMAVTPLAFQKIPQQLMSLLCFN